MLALALRMFLHVFVGLDVAVDGHWGDAAGLGDFGHGELPCVIHALGFADEIGGHLRFASAFAAPGPCGNQPGLGQCRSVKYLNGDFWLVSWLWPVGVVEAFGGPFRDLAFDDARV